MILKSIHRSLSGSERAEVNMSREEVEIIERALAREISGVDPASALRLRETFARIEWSRSEPRAMREGR